VSALTPKNGDIWVDEYNYATCIPLKGAVVADPNHDGSWIFGYDEGIHIDAGTRLLWRDGQIYTGEGSAA